MEIRSESSGRDLTLSLRGELDHHAARDTVAQLEQALDAALPLRLTLDFSGVTFMDSSGIAVVMHALRRMTSFGGTLTLRHVPAQAGKVFDAAGISRLVAIQKEGTT